MCSKHVLLVRLIVTSFMPFKQSGSPKQFVRIVIYIINEVICDTNIDNHAVSDQCQFGNPYTQALSPLVFVSTTESEVRCTEVHISRICMMSVTL